MSLERERTCCFTGHRPDKLPWGADEMDPRCRALKDSLLRELEGLYQQGYRHFISGMARGCDLYFAEAALALRARYGDVTVEGAVPCLSQPDRWPAEEKRRWRQILDHCDMETLVQQHYDRFCMHRRDRYLVDRSAAVLAVFDGTAGGTRYTLDYAMSQKLQVILLDPLQPARPAVRLSL